MQEAQSSKGIRWLTVASRSWWWSEPTCKGDTVVTVITTAGGLGRWWPRGIGVAADALEGSKGAGSRCQHSWLGTA